MLLNESLTPAVITLQGITIRDGFSSQDGVAGGMTVRFARVVFRDGAFINNAGGEPGTGGGGIVVAEYSQAEFYNCTFEGNTARRYWLRTAPSRITAPTIPVTVPLQQGAGSMSATPASRS